MKPGNQRGAVTLIELLVVISIMAVLAALTMPVLAAVKRHQYLGVARVELNQIATALEYYKVHYGIYPPSNPSNPALNPLYYEFSGVTNAGGTIETMDGASAVPASGYSSMFNVAGAVNSSKGSGDEAARAPDFLAGLKQARIGSVVIGGVAVSNLITSVGGPDQSYLTSLMGQGFGGNPFRYTCPGTNNPNTFDLWIDLQIRGSTNRISNWNQATLLTRSRGVRIRKIAHTDRAQEAQGKIPIELRAEDLEKKAGELVTARPRGFGFLVGRHEGQRANAGRIEHANL